MRADTVTFNMVHNRRSIKVRWNIQARSRGYYLVSVTHETAKDIGHISFWTVRPPTLADAMNIVYERYDEVMKRRHSRTG